MAKRAADKFDDTAAPCGARVIAQRAVSDLIPYANNARTHSDAQVAQIAGSIREFGFNNPVLVDGANGIIAAHGRVLAARKLGLDNVPVIELAHLSDAQKRAYILADNRLAENAGWDKDLLSLELAELSELGIDLGDLGFDGAELDALFEHGATAFAEETPPAREVLAQSRTMKGGGAAGVATLGAAGVEVAQNVLTETQTAILPLVPYLDTLRWVFVAVAMVGIAVTIYARLDDWRRGQR